VTGKERIMAVMNHQKPDRMPCWGANSTPTFPQMEKAQAFWPEAHLEGEAMAKQAAQAYYLLGFDAVRVPFSQIYEAEALGCIVKSGREKSWPGIDRPGPYKLDDTLPEFPSDFLDRGHIPAVLEAIRLLKKEFGDSGPAIVGGMIGPFTIAADLVEVEKMLKATFKQPDKIPPFIDFAEKAGTMFANAMIDAGADIIVNEDMTASPDLIIPKSYGALELEPQKRQFAAMKKVPKVLHICGKVDSIVEWMGQTGADCLSIEPAADVALAREKCGPDMVLMGGVDVKFTLFSKGPEDVMEESEAEIAKGLQMLAPGCSIAPGSPTENLVAMVEVAKRH